MVTRELRNYNGHFTSVPEVKVRIAEEFEKTVPSRFSFGYFNPGPTTKHWLCCDEDLVALYILYKAYPGKEILLWCEGSVPDDPSKLVVKGGKYQQFCNTTVGKDLLNFIDVMDGAVV